MNEEEKEVVELLQHCQNTYIEDTLVTHLQLTTEEAKILLNLVEKQQKEIEEYKKRCKDKIEEYKKKCIECNFQNTGICKEFKAHYNCSIQSVLEVLKELLGE